MESGSGPSIAVGSHGWWKPACAALTIDAPIVPCAFGADGNAYAATVNERIANGSAIRDALSDRSIDFLIDNGGTGLSFLETEDAPGDVGLTHEFCGAVLCSHFIDPIVTAFQGLDWAVVWQCLRSDRWIKAVWDYAQVVELQRFGIPNVVHLPMAAPDRTYDTRPIDPGRCDALVSFIGGQNTTFFNPEHTPPSNCLVPGVIAHAVSADLPDVRFLDTYFDLYAMDALPQSGDAQGEWVRKTAAYFNAKLYYNAALCLRNRDRFVIFLKRALGDKFRLIGRRWDIAYGLSTEPPLPTDEAYFQFIRNSAININLVNGNAETSVNMRHFEITAAGGFMLCHDRPELGRYFEIGKECAVFTNERDLLDKIDYYLRHPDERVKIAQAGQRRTLNEHLYSHRLKTLMRLFESNRRTSKTESLVGSS